MSLKKHLLNEIAQTGLITVYHGTDDLKKSFEDNNKIFTSKDKEFVKSYGEHIFEFKIDVRNVFDSTTLEDIQKLYDSGFKLNDEYLDLDVDFSKGSHWVNDYYYFYDDKGYGHYPTPQHFIDGRSDNNTWEAIEMTEGVMDWIEINNYDCIYLMEDGIETYFVLDMDIIKSKKKIS